MLVAGCKDSNNNNEPEPVKPLAGTKWKLVKLMHTETKVERDIYVGDDICIFFVPTMKFDTVLVSTKSYTSYLSSFDLILQIVKKIYHSFL